MSQEKVIERVNAELEPIIERFMENSRHDLVAMRASLKHGDYDTIQRLGHNCKGAGYGYGFVGMGDIGVRIEAAAGKRDNLSVATELDSLQHYLETVEVSLV